MKRINAWICILLLVGGSLASAGMAELAVYRGIPLAEEQSMQDIEDYINQKDENEAAKAKSKRGDQARKPLLPIYQKES